MSVKELFYPVYDLNIDLVQKNLFLFACLFKQNNSVAIFAKFVQGKNGLGGNALSI